MLTVHACVIDCACACTCTRYIIIFQSNRDWFAYFPEFANETRGPYALRWKSYKAHYYTQGWVNE